MFSISVLFVAIVLFLLLLKVLMNDYHFLEKFPGPPLYPIVGNLFELIGTNQAKVFLIMRKYCRKYGTFRMWAMGNGHIHVSRAKEVEVLLSSSRHSDKSNIYNFLSDFLGTGLLISNGQKWQKRRKILTPAFHFHILQQFTPIFNEESAKVVDRIRERVTKGDRVLDASKICCRLTLNIICETAMGVKLDGLDGTQADDYRKNLYKVAEIIVHRVMRPWLYVDWIFKLLGYQRQMDKFVGRIQGFTKSIINKRRDMFYRSQGEQAMEDEVQVENM